jgi:hypothetical protein
MQDRRDFLKLVPALAALSLASLRSALQMQKVKRLFCCDHHGKL